MYLESQLEKNLVATYLEKGLGFIYKITSFTKNNFLKLAVFYGIKDYENPTKFGRGD